MPSGCIARLDLALDALAIALAVNIPLRIGDLHRFQIGVHLSRSIERDTWTVDLRTAKTGSDYVAKGALARDFGNSMASICLRNTVESWAQAGFRQPGAGISVPAST